MYQAHGLSEKEDGWYRIPGKIDPISWLLVVFFVATMMFLYLFSVLI